MAGNNNKSSSPNKFLSLLFGGKARRREQRAANEQYEFWLDEFAQQKMNNPYAGVKNQYEGMENVYEDAQVNLQAADYEWYASVSWIVGCRWISASLS